MAREGPAAPTRPAAGGGAPPAPAQPRYWAQADIVVDGRDMSDVLLALQPGITISGTIRFEASRLAAAG